MKTFSDIFKAVFDHVFHSCAAKQIDFVYDSYLETSIKELERMRHAKLYNPISYRNFTENTLVPADMDRFWSCSKNKEHLEILSRYYFVGKASDYKISIVLSGYVTDAEGVQPCVQGTNGILTQRDDLESSIEEADERIIPHVAKAVQSGSTNVLVLSNDADVVVLLIHYLPQFKQLGLKELWIEYGTGKSKRFIPVHNLWNKLTTNVRDNLLKVHILTGCDVTSKVGTKMMALKRITDLNLINFGCKENGDFIGFKKAEQYLIDVLQANSKCKSFDELR